MASTSVPLLASLRATLGETLRGLGFIEKPPEGRNNLVHSWLRADGLELYFHRNHQPWLVPVLGNTFTGGFSYSGANVIAQMDGRIWFLLSDSEIAEMRSIHDRVLAELPDPADVPDLFDTERSGAREWRLLFAKPWIRNHEVSFRYRTMDDLRMWLAFLEPLIPQLAARYCDKFDIPFRHA